MSAARPLEGTETTKEDRARAVKLQSKAADLRKVVRALRVLSEAPLRSGSDLAEQGFGRTPRRNSRTSPTPTTSASAVTGSSTTG